MATLGRAGGFAQRAAINGSGNANGQYVEHQANDDLAGAHGDIHPGQQEIEDDAGQHRCQQADPNHAGYIISEETGQRTEQNRAFDTYVQHSGASANVSPSAARRTGPESRRLAASQVIRNAEVINR